MHYNHPRRFAKTLTQSEAKVTSLQHSANPRHRYTVIPRVLIFPEYDGKVLLLKGAPTKPLWPNLYNGIGGHVEPGETIKQAALRELEEETAIQAGDVKLCGMVNIRLRGDMADIMLFVFICAVDSPMVQSGPEGELQWHAWDNLPQADLMPDLPILLPRIRQTADSRRPFYALYTYDSQGSLEITFTE